MMIELSNISKVYGEGEAKTLALREITLKIKEGEFVAIVGPSGSGKSTLLHIMGLLDRQTEGIYKFEGKDTSEFSDDELSEIRNKKMGFVFQMFNLLPRMTALENVELPLIYSSIPERKRKEMAKRALEEVGISHRMNFYPNQMSGGEQQRVAIARAIVNQPSIIFADEPTGNLDSKSGKVVMDFLKKLNKLGKTIVLVTHEKYTASAAERIVSMRDGKIISDENKIKFEKENILK